MEIAIGILIVIAGLIICLKTWRAILMESVADIDHDSVRDWADLPPDSVTSNYIWEQAQKKIKKLRYFYLLSAILIIFGFFVCFYSK